MAGTVDRLPHPPCFSFSCVRLLAAKCSDMEWQILSAEQQQKAQDTVPPPRVQVQIHCPRGGGENPISSSVVLPFSPSLVQVNLAFLVQSCTLRSRSGPLFDLPTSFVVAEGSQRTHSLLVIGVWWLSFGPPSISQKGRGTLKLRQLFSKS
ncbi:hypothetical protein LZ32DRAFT_75431 [Colletotrichum eremochloae]|nr:hypothetical protein LZ32DRAFT_75431 [Colletotrichum eremochloae]